MWQLHHKQHPSQGVSTMKSNIFYWFSYFSNENNAHKHPGGRPLVISRRTAPSLLQLFLWKRHKNQQISICISFLTKTNRKEKKRRDNTGGEGNVHWKFKGSMFLCFYAQNFNWGVWAPFLLFAASFSDQNIRWGKAAFIKNKKGRKVKRFVYRKRISRVRRHRWLGTLKDIERRWRWCYFINKFEFSCSRLKRNIFIWWDACLFLMSGSVQLRLLLHGKGR